ncbi:hypothetical protein Q8A73_003310 [Channa argus]|nr:hypothetical protein Q8A73_003310 [Channa argus]
MLKIVFVLGCLLCLTLANPTDDKAPKRFARGRGSHEHHRGPPNSPLSRKNMLTPEFLQYLLSVLQQLLTPPPATTSTAAATSTTATAATTTTTTTTTAATERLFTFSAMKLLVLVLCFLAISYALPISEEENDRVKRSSSREERFFTFSAMKLLVLVLCLLALSYALPISEEENDRVKRSSSGERGGYYPQMIPQMFPPYIPPPPPNQDMTALLQLLIARLAAGK